MEDVGLKTVQRYPCARDIDAVRLQIKSCITRSVSAGLKGICLALPLKITNCFD